MADVRQRLATVVLLTAAVAFVVPAGTALAAVPNQLVAPTISPAGGPEGTTFGLTVVYQGRHPSLTVFAEVSGQTVLLPLISGTDTDGTYAAGIALPMGTHSVVFRADAVKGNDPEIPGGTIAVTAPTPAPTATPAPSAQPAPTAPPAATAPTAPPVASAPVAPPATTQAPPAAAQAAPPNEAGATPVEAAPTSAPETPTSPSSPEATAPEPSKPAGSYEALPIVGSSIFGSGPGDAEDLLWTVLMAGIGVIGLVVVFGFFMGRRRHEPVAERVAAVFAAPVAPAEPRKQERARAPAAWELAAQLEDAPLGTTDFAPLPNGLTIGEIPDNVESIERPKRMNPRMARMMAARGERGQLWGS